MRHNKLTKMVVDFIEELDTSIGVNVDWIKEKKDIKKIKIPNFSLINEPT